MQPVLVASVSSSCDLSLDDTNRPLCGLNAVFSKDRG